MIIRNSYFERKSRLEISKPGTKEESKMSLYYFVFLATLVNVAFATEECNNGKFLQVIKELGTF